MGALSKAVKTLNAVHVMVDVGGGGNSTLSVAAAAGAATITVASATGFTTNDDFHVGSDENLELCRGTLSGSVFTLSKPLQFDHASGEAVVEAQSIALGLPEAEGFKNLVAGQETDVFVATNRLAYTKLQGFVDLGCSWRYPVITIDVLALALGIPRAQIIGNGTNVAQTGTVGPRCFTSDGLLIGTVTRISVVATVTMKDDTYARVEYFNLSFDPSALGLNFARGSLSTVGVKAAASGGAVHFDAATLWVPSTTLSTFNSSKADVFNNMTVFSELTDSGTATTASSQVSAGAFVIPVAATTGIVNGSWIKIGTGDTAEWHKVHGLASLNVNLYTQVKNVQASGVAVVVQTKTAVAGVTGGVGLGVNAQLSQDRLEERRVTVGTSVGNVTLSLTSKLNSVTPENVQRMLNVPSSAVANNRIPLGNAIGSDGSKTYLYEGVTQGNKFVSYCLWNGTLSANGEFAFTNAAKAELPISLTPQVIQAFVNA